MPWILAMRCAFTRQETIVFHHLPKRFHILVAQMITVVRMEAHRRVDLRIALRERKRRATRRQIEADLCKRTDAMDAEIRDDRIALIVEDRIAEMCVGVKNFT